jgi:hypothetical protein
MQMLETKVDYIHRNPCMGKWNLASDFTLYLYSSAAHYEGLLKDEFVTHYREI